MTGDAGTDAGDAGDAGNFLRRKFPCTLQRT